MNPCLCKRTHPAQPPLLTALLIAPDGHVVASSYPARYPANRPFSLLLLHQSAAVTQALRGVSSYAKMVPETTYVAETVWGKHGQPIGALYIEAQEEPINFTSVLQSAASNWFPLTIIVLLVLVITTPIGNLFSLLTTRGLVRRIRHLAQATTKFAGGDYDQRVRISRQDEVGQLENHFNQMADQLLVSTRQQQYLAGQNARLAERTRISREIHDALSQDLFSLRMLAYGLQDALPQGSEVQAQVATIERTSSRMIREMRALLLELRPVHPEQPGLAEALKDLVASYGERLEIHITSEIAPVSLSADQELIAAVRAAAHGESRLHPMVATHLLKEMRAREQSPLKDLTPRELEILTYIARGRSNAEIAAVLVISEGTVKMHVSNILSKLHLADRTQAAIYALQKRLVPLNEALDETEK